METFYGDINGENLRRKLPLTCCGEINKRYSTETFYGEAVYRYFNEECYGDIL